MSCIKSDCTYWIRLENRCLIYKRLPKNKECRLTHSISGSMNAERPKYGY